MIIDRKLVSAPIKFALQRILEALDGRLTLSDNIQSYTTLINTTTAGGEIALPHKLGKTPTQIIITPLSQCQTWASRLPDWTDQVVYLRCSTAGTTLVITLLS